MDWTEYGRAKFKKDLALVWRQVRKLEGRGADEGQVLGSDYGDWLYKLRDPELLARALRRVDLGDEKRFIVRLCVEGLILDFFERRHDEREVLRHAEDLGFAPPLAGSDAPDRLCRAWAPLLAWPDAKWKVSDWLLPARCMLELAFARAVDAENPIRPDAYEFWHFLGSACGDVPSLPGHPGQEFLADSLRLAAKAVAESLR